MQKSHPKVVKARDIAGERKKKKTKKTQTGRTEEGREKVAKMEEVAYVLPCKGL